MIWLRSGRLVDPLNLDLSLVTVEDLAWSLGNVSRFGGHCDPPVSVAQHTLACARQAAKESPVLALLALHHDDGEAFFGDMPRDLKARPEMAWYRAQEHRCTLRCIEHFAPACLDLPLRAVKPIDTRSMLTERRDRFPADKDATDYHPPVDPLPKSHYYASDTWETWVKLHYKLTDRAERWLAAGGEAEPCEI